ARKRADAGDRRISLRQFYTYGKLRSVWGENRAAELVFGERASSFLDAVKVDTVTTATS
ncbi:uncharacterized protein METZ01_LOCUS509200, partial [marine metagenome]